MPASAAVIRVRTARFRLELVTCPLHVADEHVVQRLHTDRILVEELPQGLDEDAEFGRFFVVLGLGPVCFVCIEGVEGSCSGSHPQVCGWVIMRPTHAMPRVEAFVDDADLEPAGWGFPSHYLRVPPPRPPVQGLGLPDRLGIGSSSRLEAGRGKRQCGV